MTAEGRSERGNYPVFKRSLRQWMMRITAYGDRLIEDLDTIDWPEKVRTMQRNWIGRSHGAEVDFRAVGDGVSDSEFTVYTTRPDTLFGATFVVWSPEHPLPWWNHSRFFLGPGCAQTSCILAAGNSP